MTGMRVDILTLFPDSMRTVLGESIIGRAAKKGILDIQAHQIRDYTENKQMQVDDYPYGGGMGMIMQAQPIYDCFEALFGNLEQKPHVIYMSPKGKTFNQKRACELAEKEHIVLLCGHYEGIDERVLEEIVDEEISIGDYVLTGGEMAAVVVTDAVSRMLPGVLSDDICFQDESHFAGLLEYPQYTRPAEWRGKKVPDVLLSGHHANIEKWRREQAILTTYNKRPEMLNDANLTQKEKEFIQSLNKNN